ncbi:MAG: DUF423 domain-containing protein [Hyphomicrobium sp.]
MSDNSHITASGASSNTDVGGALLAVLSVAGLVGAAGVGLAAIAAHKLESPTLATASTMLMIHATAVVALLAVAMRVSRPRLWIAVAAVMLAAVALFSGAVTYQAFIGTPIIKGAAPTGGTLLIASWIVVALLAIREALCSRNGRGARP